MTGALVIEELIVAVIATLFSLLVARPVARALVRAAT